MRKHIQIGFKKGLSLKYKIQVEYNFNICEGGGSAEKTKLGEAGEALAGGRQVSLVQAEAGKNCYTSFMSWHLYWSKKHKIAWCKVFSFQSYIYNFEVAGAQGRLLQLGRQLPQACRGGCQRKLYQESEWDEPQGDAETLPNAKN